VGKDKTACIQWRLCLVCICFLALRIVSCFALRFLFCLPHFIVLHLGFRYSFFLSLLFFPWTLAYIYFTINVGLRGRARARWLLTTCLITRTFGFKLWNLDGRMDGMFSKGAVGMRCKWKWGMSRGYGTGEGGKVWAIVTMAMESWKS